MNIIDFVRLAKKHRLSVEKFDFPDSLEGWENIIGESLIRNNSLLLDDLYLKCPVNYKEDIDSYINNTVFCRTLKFKNEYSQTILNWVFDHLDVNLDSVFHPVFVAEHAREDIIDFLIKNNLENIFEDRLYQISKWLAKEEQVELFQKIAAKLDINTIHDSKTQYKGIKSPESNPFVELFNSTKDKEVLKYVLKNLPDEEDFYLSIIKNCVGTFKYIGENIRNDELFDITLSFIKKNRPTYYAEFKNKIQNNESKVVFKTLHRLSIFNVKTLENHDLFTNYLLYRAIETVGSQEFSEILQKSLNFLYESFSEDLINEAFTPKHKMELFTNLMIRESTTEAEFILAKAPYVLDDEIKKYITSVFLNKGLNSKSTSGVEWAKKYLTYDEIDQMSQKQFYNRQIEQLTLWKCENFLYSESKNNGNKVEKKKIKL